MSTPGSKNNPLGVISSDILGSLKKKKRQGGSKATLAFSFRLIKSADLAAYPVISKTQAMASVMKAILFPPTKLTPATKAAG